jgi:hypothetical protein
MDVVGYAMLKSGLGTRPTMAMGDENSWNNAVVRLLEHNESTEAVLVHNLDTGHLGMFDFEDIQSKFLCKEISNVIIPPSTSFLENLSEVDKRINRKGGYNEFIKKMVIVASLNKGKLCDDFLFQKQ